MPASTNANDSQAPTPISPVKQRADAGDNPPWIRYVAMLTGVLAGVAGFLTVRGANLSNEAIYHSNQGVLHQAKASDAWSEYQANSIKARIIETQIKQGKLDPEARTALEADDKEFRNKQPVVKAQALEFEKQRDEELKDGSQRLGEKDTLDYAGVAVQLGIALASVAALTRTRHAFYAAIVLGALGIAITASVLLPHILLKVVHMGHRT